MERKLNVTGGLILAGSLLVVGFGLVMPNSDMTALAIAIMSTLLLIILDIRVPAITNLTEDDPRVRSMRAVCRMSMTIILVSILFVTLFPQGQLDRLLASGLVFNFMVTLGKLSPDLPFNRYIGLRLPWTIRDREVWDIAHKILGYVSFPIAFLQLAIALIIESELVIPLAIAAWVIIPSIYSLMFCYGKYRH